MHNVRLVEKSKWHGTGAERSGTLFLSRKSWSFGPTERWKDAAIVIVWFAGTAGRYRERSLLLLLLFLRRLFFLVVPSVPNSRFRQRFEKRGKENDCLCISSDGKTRLFNWIIIGEKVERASDNDKGNPLRFGRHVFLLCRSSSFPFDYCVECRRCWRCF